MTLKPIPNEEELFDKVLVDNEGRPFCRDHGAMNKVSVFPEGKGGYWRCISAVSRQNDNICRAGCIQTD